MKTFYLVESFDLHYLEEILLAATKRDVRIVAVERTGVESLTRADYVDLSCREDGEILFQVMAETRDKAETIIDNISDEVYTEEEEE